MASGDSVVQILEVMAPAGSAATLDAVAGGATPAENWLVYDFAGGTAEFMDYKAKLEGYGGGGLTFTLPYAMSSATSGTVVWNIGIRRMNAGADIADSHTYQYNAVADAVPGGAGSLAYPTVTFTDGADMDSWAEGEMAVVRVRRNAGTATDDAAGDAELWSPPLGLES